MIQKKGLTTINSRKYDNSIHRSWQAQLIERNNSHLVFRGAFEKAVNHEQIGFIRRGTISYEFYWLDRCYNIFRFGNPNGTLRNFYCNVNLPPTFENNILNYVDLDIDLLVWKDFTYEILDTEEFEENSKKYKYPIELIENVKSNLDMLIALLKDRKYPFNFTDAAV